MSGHAQNKAKKKQRERWNARHPEGHKTHSHRKRGHDCKYI